MRAEIITIGDEILYGQTVDTNATFIGQRLTQLGIEVALRTSVGDDIEKIGQAINNARSRVDLIITTGGLGPTDDDLTKKAVVKVFKRNLIFHEEILKKVEEGFAKRGMKMPKINQNQALIPQGSKTIDNHWGSAPGIFIQEDKLLFFALPGVPLEMKTMLDEGVLPILRETIPQITTLHRTLRTTGIAESAIYEKIKRIVKSKSPIKFAFLPSFLGVDIRLTITSPNIKEAQEKIAERERKLREILDEYIYGTDNQTLEGVVGELLLKKKMALATAESCTGGLLGVKITNISGSSKYFERGVITYSNQAKTDLIGVPKQLIEKYGAVSQEVAVSMAEGVRKLAGVDIGISITGIAGPTGGTLEKPVGLVYIGLVSKDSSFAEKFQFGEERETNRQRAAQAALNMLRLYLLK
jgi:nicotinamide-nucleotide amidase